MLGIWWWHSLHAELLITPIATQFFLYWGCLQEAVHVMVMSLEAAIILPLVHTASTSGDSRHWHFTIGFCVYVKEDGNFCPSLLCSASLIFPCGKSVHEDGCILLGNRWRKNSTDSAVWRRYSIKYIQINSILRSTSWSTYFFVEGFLLALPLSKKNLLQQQVLRANRKANIVKAMHSNAL